MGAGREGEAEEATNISYPSPGAEALDAGPFYHTTTAAAAATTRDETQDHHEHQVHQEHQEHQGQPEDQHHDPGQVHRAEPVNNHMAAHEPSSPQHHLARPPNLEELQLAAQLGQGLAVTPIMSATDPSMNVEDPSMRSIMPHPEQDQHQQQQQQQQQQQPQPQPQPQPAYVPEPATSDHLVQHTMQVPVGPPMPTQYLGDGIPPRKRSKVSRACDECRRKKIKYIKELADRIHSIENKLESEVPAEDLGRKRHFSGISSSDFSTPAPPRQAPWGSEPRPILPAPTATDDFGSPGYANLSLVPQPSAIKADATPPKPPVAPMDAQMPDAEVLPDIDEAAYNDYLSHVQEVYPILPSSKLRMQALLSQCPASIRSAFMTAILAVGQSSGDTKLASSLLHDFESGDATCSRAGDIVHAQTLLLLIIDADWRASSDLPFLLARAVALANTMKLWKFTPIESASEQDTDDQLCVRIWWSLVLMDRWHAAGTGKPSQIPDYSVVAPAGLENAVGEVCFYLIRLSKLLNRISFVLSTLQPGASTAEPSMAAILGDYIENYREDLPGHIEAASHPLVHLAFWHCKLLVTLLTPGVSPTETLWPTSELADLLLRNAQLRSPYTNHFVSLAVMSLARLAKTDASREGAVRVMKDILDRPPGGHWDAVRDKLTDQLRPTTTAEATASQGLQHLADLATAHEGIAAGDDLSFAPTLASGYLDIGSA
ncbi:putative transcriptional regulatory protein [Escovopsis weberi]|uniref:Putative transcriptional regulatory protein n=1 Tax=Escovopsis weberi TaxID=150374 RepID=A0A0M8MW73_ESCWE|nr:putative transcriptional regulatory protein [Escovopsis weberi]